MLEFLSNRFFELTGSELVFALIIYFMFISFTGWLIEMMYLGSSGKGIINAGFLQGPFCPAYAAGTLFIYPFTILLAPFSIWLQLLVYAFMAVVIEYIASLLLEKIMGLRIWDYSDEPLNINGRISIKYAFFWFLLVSALVFFIQPAAVSLIMLIPEGSINLVGMIVGVLMVMDFIYSGIVYSRSKNSIRVVCEKMDFPQEELFELQFNRTRIMNENKRITELFQADEYKALDKKIIDEVFTSEIFEKDPEFLESISDIIENQHYASWSKHTDKTALLYGEHLRIAELIWKFSEFKQFDKRAAVRGTMLAVYHREKLYPHEMFGRWLFPQISIARWVRKDLFKPSKIEKDIILCYKWPLNLKMPNSQEGLLVSFADKIIKSKEFRNILKNLYPEQLKD